MDEDGKKFENPSTDNANASDQLPPGPGVSSGQQPGSNSAAVKSSKKPMIILPPSGVTSDGSAHRMADLMPTKDDSGLFSKSRVQNSGTASPVRASKRNASTSDQDSLEKATKLKARRNLDSSSGKGKGSQPPSFSTLDDSAFLARANSLGVVLGNNEQEVSHSINTFRDLEFLRLEKVDQQAAGNSCVLDVASSVCSLEDNLELQTLNLICSEISEGLGDGGCDSLCLQTPVSQKTKARSKNRKKNNTKQSR
jgi:hypothetical protein